MATAHNGRPPPAAWLAEAVRETVGVGSGLAWDLLEAQLLQQLALQVERNCPQAKLVAIDGAAALAPARTIAAELVARHERLADGRRESLARVALASMQVRHTAL
eukprot:scaffold21401_cov27-Tisochrysis_lutea.AAC.1